MGTDGEMVRRGRRRTRPKTSFYKKPFLYRGVRRCLGPCGIMSAQRSPLQRTPVRDEFFLAPPGCSECPDLFEHAHLAQKEHGVRFEVYRELTDVVPTTGADPFDNVLFGSRRR